MKGRREGGNANRKYVKLDITRILRGADYRVECFNSTSLDDAIVVKSAIRSARSLINYS